jgi:hypothetical protein
MRLLCMFVDIKCTGASTYRQHIRVGIGLTELRIETN